MPLWLDMLRTPMAAPETRDLRRLRRIWQVLCLLLAASVAGLQPLMRPVRSWRLGRWRVAMRYKTLSAACSLGKWPR